MRTGVWLNDLEMHAWRSFVVTAGEVLADLDTDLMRDHGLTFGDYEVLVLLSMSSERSMRMCDLAARLRLSPSGLTRRLDGLVKAGRVDRKPSSIDRRVSLAVLTDDGLAALQTAAPDHVESVRVNLLRFLSDEQLQAMGDAFLAIYLGRHADDPNRLLVNPPWVNDESAHAAP